MRSFLLLPFLSLLVHAQSQCFSPDGKVLPSDGAFFSGFQPCASGGPSTICCATNRTNPAGGDASKGDTKDECLGNGLCQNRATKNGVETTVYFANFCTDSNYTSGNCLNICDQARGNGGSGNVQVTPCTSKADSDRWCCGTSNACCGTGVGLITLPQKFGGAINIVSSSVVASSTLSSSTTRRSSSASSSATSSSPSSSASSPASSESSSPSPTPAPKKSGLGGGAIAGIVIGALAGVALLGAAIFFALRAKRYKRAAAEPSTLGPQPAEVHANTAIPPQYDGYANGTGRSEKYARGQYSPGSDVPLAELQQPPSELPGSEGGMKVGR